MLKRNRWDQQPQTTIPPEKYFLDDAQTGLAGGGALANTLILTGPRFGMPLGTGPSARTGAGVYLHDLTIKYNFKLAATTTGWDCVRIMIFNDREYHGVVPTAAQLMSTDSNVGNLNVAFDHRFQILHDEIHPMVTGAESAVISRKLKIPINKSFRVRTTDNLPDGFTLFYATWSGPGFATAQPTALLNGTLTYTPVE